MEEYPTNQRADANATGGNDSNPVKACKGDAAAERAASQREERGNENLPVTKSGREVKPPFRHKDYVVDKN